MEFPTLVLPSKHLNIRLNPLPVLMGLNSVRFQSQPLSPVSYTPVSYTHLTLPTKA